MASAPPALDLSSAAADDPPKTTLGGNPSEPLSDHPIAPDQFDPAWETDKLEIWSYYAYYIGNNGLTLFNFAPTAFQNLLYQAAGDGTTLNFAGGGVCSGGIERGEERAKEEELIGIGTARLIALCCYPMGSVSRFKSWCFCSWGVLLVFLAKYCLEQLANKSRFRDLET